MSSDNPYVYDTSNPPANRPLTAAEQALQDSLGSAGIKRVQVYESHEVSRFTYTYDIPEGAERTRPKTGQPVSGRGVTYTYDVRGNCLSKTVERQR